MNQSRLDAFRGGDALDEASRRDAWDGLDEEERGYVLLSLIHDTNEKQGALRESVEDHGEKLDCITGALEELTKPSLLRRTSTGTGVFISGVIAGLAGRQASG